MEPSKEPKQRHWKRRRHAALIVLLAAGVAACTDAGEGAIAAAGARQLCDDAIRAAASDPARVEIPPKEVRETVQVYSFVWRTGDRLLMPGQAGVQTETLVTCRVNKEARAVVHLEIDGQMKIPRQGRVE